MPQVSPPQPRRHLPLEGTHNVRDLGGYATHDDRVTRWHRLFRADSLHRLPSTAQTELLSHGVRTVIDLRRTDEVKAAPNVFATAQQVRYHHVSLLHDTPPATDRRPQPLVTMYQCILDERQAQVRKVLRALAAPAGVPAIFHCTAGKDRTGVISALALGIAGVPADTIIADYALTATHLGEAFFAETRQRVLQRGQNWQEYQPLLGCPPEYMRTTLTYIETHYGGIAAYVRAIGLSSEEIAQLRTALVTTS
jgi:protein-tyrosine phosphatase